MREGGRIISTHELLRLAKVETFDAAKIARRLVEERGGVACRPGCAHCCASKIVVDRGIGALIALELLKQGRWSPGLEARLGEEDRRMTAATHAEHFVAARPCVFLDRGYCSIYAVRPINCALTFSHGPDPRACAEPGGRALAMVVDPRLVNACSPMYEAVLRGLGETERYVMTLPGAVLWAGRRLRGLEPPPLFALPAEVERAEPLEEAFDREGAAWAGGT